MYTHSMVGKGAMIFAVWPYVIAHMRADGEVGAQVDLNPKIMAPIFGESEDAIVKAIKELCSPDPMSTSPAEEGRRLVKVGQFAYRVVNGAAYMAIRNEEEKREYNRLRKRRQREATRLLQNGKPLAGERDFVKAVERGDESEADRIAAQGLPRGGSGSEKRIPPAAFTPAAGNDPDDDFGED